jgi:hypothetical protein
LLQNHANAARVTPLTMKAVGSALAWSLVLLLLMMMMTPIVGR